MTNPEALKPREIEVVRLMAEGLTNREIGARLYIGVETVRTYAKRIYSKLHVSGRAEAAAKAEKLGLLADKPADSPPDHKSKPNLPIQLTSFIGRAQQIAELTGLLATHRLLTLVGPGGSGKTRLCLKVAEAVAADFAQEVYFVDLAPVGDPEMVVQTIARTLGILESGDQPLATLKRAISQRQLLLVLDNYEHLIVSAPLVAELLSSAPHIKVLVTSREPLRVSGEQLYDVPPLTLQDKAPSEPSESIALFIQRAQAVQSGFRLHKNNREAVLAICRALDGMPLAIELAAAQARYLTPDAILQRMDTRFQLLRGGARDAAQRQQTLQATLDWSYDLLTEEEKRLFARLAVFRGGRSLEAVEEVCREALAIDRLEGLASLVDKSMVRQIEDPLGDPRFVMLETLRAYARQRLEAGDELAATQRRHAHYFMALAERAAPQLRLAQQEWWFSKLDLEYNNLRTALAWALSGRAGERVEIGLRTVVSLRDYWWYQGLHGEGGRWIGQALQFAQEAPAQIRADLYQAAGTIAWLRNDLAAAHRHEDKARVLYQELDDQRGIAWTLLKSAGPIIGQEETLKRQQAALRITRELGDLPMQAMVLNALGLTHLYFKEFAQAQAVFEECRQIVRQTGEKRREAMALASLGSTAFSQARFDQARTYYLEALLLARSLNYFPYLIHEILWHCLHLFVERQAWEPALTLLAAAKAREQATGQFADPLEAQRLGAVIEKLQTLRNESASYRRAYEKGRQMSLEEAVDYTLRALVV